MKNLIRKWLGIDKILEFQQKEEAEIQKQEDKSAWNKAKDILLEYKTVPDLLTAIVNRTDIPKTMENFIYLSKKLEKWR